MANPPRKNGLRRDQRPVTEDDYRQVAELHAQGLGRNEIGRRIDRAQRTVSVIAAELGLTFDRTMTAVATEAKKMDAKARRAAIVERLYARVENNLGRLESAGAGTFKFTTSTGQGIDTVSLDHVPGQEEKALAAAISQYLNQAARLEALDGDPGVDAARSMLGALADGINRLASLDGEDDSEEG